MIYLDNAATTQPTEQVINDMQWCMEELWSNPSSAYSFSHKAKMLLEGSRKKIANTINAAPEEIVFTSGGTEANNIAIMGPLSKYTEHFITSSIEHPSVLSIGCAAGNRGYFLPVDKNGRVSILSLVKKIVADDFYYPLVSIMMTNNEIGVIQDIKDLATITHNYGGIFHTDAVQAYGHIPIDVKKLDVDLMSVSAHKWGGPKGAGFLYIKKGVRINNVVFGGHQEFGIRPGTENLPAIYAMANQAELICKNESINKYKDLKGFLTTAVKNEIKSAHINCDSSFAQSNIVSITIPEIKAQQLIALLSERGIYVSAGAACNSGEQKPSHVLKAIGLSDDEAECTIRVSFGDSTSIDMLKEFINQLKNCIEFLKL